MYRRNSCFVRATTLQAAEKLKEVPQGRLNLAQDAILGRPMEDEQSRKDG
jgi:hypothetical protein